MRAGQREARGGMVEWLDLFPAARVMAILAIATKLSTVGIVGFVARSASSASATEIVATPVAAGATNLRVAAGQRIGCQIVIEAVADEPDEGIATPLVLAVAGLAGAGPGSPIFAMIPCLFGNIGANSLVARKAPAVLRLLAERSVAAVAIALQLGMAGTQRPRRDQPFQDRLCCDGGGQCQA